MPVGRVLHGSGCSLTIGLSSVTSFKPLPWERAVFAALERAPRRRWSHQLVVGSLHQPVTVAHSSIPLSHHQSEARIHHKTLHVCEARAALFTSPRGERCLYRTEQWIGIKVAEKQVNISLPFWIASLLYVHTTIWMSHVTYSTVLTLYSPWCWSFQQRRRRPTRTWTPVRLRVRTSFSEIGLQTKAFYN